MYHNKNTLQDTYCNKMAKLLKKPINIISYFYSINNNWYFTQVYNIINYTIEQSMSVAEIKMFWWINGVTREDITRNKYVRGIIGVTPIVDKTRVNKPKWFRHVKRKKLSKNMSTLKMLWKKCQQTKMSIIKENK